MAPRAAPRDVYPTITGSGYRRRVPRALLLGLVVALASQRPPRRARAARRRGARRRSLRSSPRRPRRSGNRSSRTSRRRHRRRRPAVRCARSSTPPRTGCGWPRSSPRADRRAPTTPSPCRRSSPTRRSSVPTRPRASGHSGRTSMRSRRSTSPRGRAGSPAPATRGSRRASRPASGWPKRATTSRAATAGR